MPAAIRAGSGAGAAARLTLRGTDEKFFQAYVRAAGACRTMPDSDRLSPAEERILEVREHFLAALLDFDAAQRRRLAEFLLEHCAVVLVATMGIDRAHRMFMVLNETGKPLARNDILKAELLGSIPGGVAGSACATWDAVEARLGAEFESLFSHVRTMYGRASSQVIAGVRAVAAECGGAEAFIGNVLAPSATILDDLRHARHAGSVHSADIARTLTYLSWLPASDWIPPAMLWWLAKGKDPAELAWFLQRLDRLAYGLRILGLGASRRAKRFGTIISAIRNGSDLKATGSPLNLLREEIRNIEHSLRDLHARSAPLCKLVLLRINDEMAGRPQGLPIGELTVEHVLPRKHGTGSAWRGAFPDAQEREQCTEALGNLVLVSKAQNDKAGNLDFARKHAIYFPPSGGPTLAINEYVRRQKQWTPAQVREREEELMKRLQALWGFGGGGPSRPRQCRAGVGRPPSPLKLVSQYVFDFAAGAWPRTSRTAAAAAMASRRTSLRMVHMWKPSSKRLMAVLGPSVCTPAIRPRSRVSLQDDAHRLQHRLVARIERRRLAHAEREVGRADVDAVQALHGQDVVTGC